MAFAGALFCGALLLRLMFWSASPDADWAYSIAYKGDAQLWLSYAQALSQGQAFELGLPLRPPGTAYLIAGLMSLGADSLLSLRLAWLVMGACLPLVLYLALRDGFAERIARIAGVLAAASTSLLVLASSLDAETPYLLLALLSLLGIDKLRRHPRWIHLLLWSAVQALACLIRAEHALLAVLLLLWLTIPWCRASRGSGLCRAAASLFSMGLVLLPWQLQAAEAIDRFNTSAVQELRAPEIPWEQPAREQLMALPAFCRQSAQGFVSACVRHRGGERVRAEDLRILQDAYGWTPAALGRYPFVALYGPLNFYLANNPLADVGFSRAALASPPQLAGGADAYDPLWLRNLPLNGELAFEYPPHLAMLSHGYAMGGAWILAHPVDFLARAVLKLERFWRGAAHGFGGYAQPIGLSGMRHRVDLVVAEGIVPAAFRLLLLLAVLLGVLSLRRRPAAWPLFLWLLSKLLISALFFGYARQGALVVPAVALFLALAWEDRIWPRLGEIGRKRATHLGMLLIAWLFWSEGWRWLRPPEIRIDGREVMAVDPWPVALQENRRLEFR